LRGTYQCSIVRAAVIQDAPVLFDKEKTVAKTIRLMQTAAAARAQLALFPEAFIPAYPRGFSFGMVVGSRSPEGRLLWQRYWENSVDVPGPETAQLAAAAGELGLFTAVGVIERAGGTLYCTILYFGADGRLLRQTSQAETDRRRTADLG
jgi:nitrilase